ncbi:hypothetical protein D6D01_06946 [Aureobasidium pullulans]|uniref:Uncharacterized protein n=1 Tax=Aureobasidium pullulans TaxID=5580 RepID=A0A4S9KU32_AURPU|nr:hypothetical protein D6D01_06946 [Aureobasidium pullulans]
MLSLPNPKNMPPPYRQPSQVGATAATKRPFKPPAIAKGGPSSSSSGNPPAHRPAAAAQASKPVAASSKAVGSRPQAWGANTTSGFQSAGAQIDKGDLEALLISDEDDYGSLSDDDDDDAVAPTTRKQIAPTTVEPAAKRQKTGPAMPPRLPSLSPLSSAIQPDPAPAPAHLLPPTHTAATIGTTNDNIPLLPSPLLTRLLHESFDDKTVKIGKDANALTARYLDLFVREAVARAAEVAKEKKEMKEAGGQGDGDDVWLDVQDLEEVAPGLVMDF